MLKPDYCSNFQNRNLVIIFHERIKDLPMKTFLA